MKNNIRPRGPDCHTETIHNILPINLHVVVAFILTLKKRRGFFERFAEDRVYPHVVSFSFVVLRFAWCQVTKAVSRWDGFCIFGIPG